MNKEENKNISPTQYFTTLKNKVDTVDSKELENMYSNCIHLLKKYKLAGQTKALMQIVFQIECIEKEIQLCELGISKFVYKDDIEYYIDNIAKDVVKVIDLENYPRNIPDDIISIINKTKHIFDKMYIVFTDYTGEVEKQVIKERREKDPILFGAFQNKALSITSERFYYLGDWIDEYCDLTLDKMIKEMKDNKDIVLDINSNTKKELNLLKKKLKEMEKNLEPKKIPLLKRIKAFFCK